MTIPSTPRKAGPYAGNGSQTAFPFTFKVFSAADVDVRVVQPGASEVVVGPESYIVTINENQESSPGGTITYPLVGAPLSTGARLAIVGALDYDQPLDLPSGGRFSDVALENGLDRIVMQVQQVAENQARALTVPATATINPLLPVPEPGALLAWNSYGTQLTNVDANTASFSTAYSERTFDTFVGNGTQTAFTLANPPANIADMDVSVDGQTFVPESDYTLASNTITFAVAPGDGAQVLIRYGRIPAALPFDVAAAVQGPFLLLDNQVTYDFEVPAGKNALAIAPTIASGVTVTVPSGSEFITLDEYIGGGGGEVNTGANIGTGLGVYAGKSGPSLRFKSLVAGTNVTLESAADTITVNATGGGSGEINTASNTGTGVGVFGSKAGADLRFKSLVAGTNITLTPDANSIVVSASGGAAGEANTASNLGTGTGLFASKSGVDLRFRSLATGTGLSLANDGSTLTLTNTAPGEVNTASNLGASGEGVFSAKAGVDLQFKKIKAGTNITLASDASSITISASGGSGSALGLLNVRDYGAVGNGSTNDTAAFNSALAAANAAGGGTVWVPPGRYKLDSAVALTLSASVSVNIAGAGVEVSVLYFTNSSGMTLTCVEGGYWAEAGGPAKGNAVSVSGVTFLAGVDGSGTALRIIGNAVTGRPVPPINITNVSVRGDDVGKAWATGIHFDKAHAANISHYNWHGKIVSATGVPLRVTADSTHNVSEFRIANCGFTYANIGVYAESYVEGIHLTNVDMVYVNTGVQWFCTAGDESELGMANCHVAALYRCVDVRNLMDSHVANSLFFTSGAPSDWTGVYFDRSAGTISGCVFGGANGGLNVGVHINNLVSGTSVWSAYHATSIVNNTFRALPYGIAVGATVSNVFVSASNQYSTEVTTRVANGGGGFVEKKNYTGSEVYSLAGGTIMAVTVNIPVNVFSAAPEAGFMMLAQNAEDIIGFYVYDTATPTSVQFVIRRRDGGVLPTGARRFSYQLSGL